MTNAFSPNIAPSRIIAPHMTVANAIMASIFAIAAITPVLAIFWADVNVDTAISKINTDPRICLVWR